LGLTNYEQFLIKEHWGNLHEEVTMTDDKDLSSFDAKPGFFYGYVVVMAALCIMLAVYGAYFAFGVFFKPMLAEFGWSRAVISGAFSISMVTQGLIGVVVGRVTDRLGSRILMTLCGFLLAIGYLLMSQVNAVWQIYMIYGVVIGAGMSASFISLTSTVARWFIKRRGIMTGIVLSGTGIGGLIAPPVATRLISTYHWRASYLIMGGVILVIVTLAAHFLRRDPTQVGQVPYGESRGEQRLGIGTWGFSLKEAVDTRQFYIASAMFFCCGFGMFALMVHSVPHTSELGFPAVTAANILAVISGLTIVGRLALGSVADRFGNRPIFIIGFILMSAALLWLVSAREIWTLYFCAAVFGFANGGMGTSESPLVAELFGLSSHGLILSIMGGGFTTGAAVGPFVAGYLFDIAGNYRVAFLVCAAVSLLGLILTLLLTPLKAEPGKRIPI
jgi:MFS family permease